MTMAVSEIQIGVRMPMELKEKLAEAAKRSGWSISAQVRFQLCHDFGIEHKPYLPTPDQAAMPFKEPMRESPGRRKRRSRT